MECQTVKVEIFEGVVSVAEIDVLDARFGPLMDATEIAQNSMGDAAAGVGDFARETVEAGGDGEVVEDVADLAAAFVVRPIFAAFGEAVGTHGGVVGGVAVHEEIAPLAEEVGMDGKIGSGRAVAF